MIFYISSQGHAATGWIAKSFSLHPDVIAFHGIRSIPPVTINEQFDFLGIELSQLSGNEPNVAQNLAKGLYYCAKHSGRVFGAVHTMWGTLMKEPVEQYSGRFSGVIRHPINQVNSMMSAFLARGLSHRELPVDFELQFSYIELLKSDPRAFQKIVKTKLTKALSRELLNKLKLRLMREVSKRQLLQKRVYEEYDEYSFPELIGQTGKTMAFDLIATEFLLSMKRTFGDHRLFAALPEVNRIVMEEIVQDVAYFKRKFKFLTGLNFSKELQSQLFEVDHVHRHAKTKRSPEEIWTLWPAEVQAIFWDYLTKRYSQLPAFYKKLGYWLP